MSIFYITVCNIPTHLYISSLDFGEVISLGNMDRVFQQSGPSVVSVRNSIDIK